MYKPKNISATTKITNDRIKKKVQPTNFIQNKQSDPLKKKKKCSKIILSSLSTKHTHQKKKKKKKKTSTSKQQSWRLELPHMTRVCLP